MSLKHKEKNHPSIQLQVLTHLLSPSLLSIWAAQSAFLHRRSAGTTFLITDVRHASCDGLVGVQLVVCLFQPSHSHNLWLNDLPNLRRKGEIIALTDRDIRCLLCQISPPPPRLRLQPNRSQTTERIFRVGPLQYLPSVRRAYSILCLFVTVHLAAGVQGHNSPPSPLLSCPPLARMDDSRYTGGQSFGCGPTSFLSAPQTQQWASPPFPQQMLQLMYF